MKKRADPFHRIISNFCSNCKFACVSLCPCPNNHKIFYHCYKRVDQFLFMRSLPMTNISAFCIRKKQAERNIASLSAQKHPNVLLCLSFFPTGIQRHTLLHRPRLYVPFFRRRTIQIPSGKTIPLSRRFINGKQCAMFNADA